MKAFNRNEIFLEKMITSSILITLALIFHSVGVWAERIARYLKSWHVAAYWAGFIFDISNTWAMHRMANGSFNPACSLPRRDVYGNDRLSKVGII